MLKAPEPTFEKRPLTPKGSHIATCYGLVQIGTVPVVWQGQTKEMEKVRLTWELPEELHEFKEGEGKKPLVISQEYTHSMGSKSNLRPIVEGILGVALQDEEAYAFDLEELLGRSCILSIQHDKTSKGNDFAFVQSASPLMKGMKAPAQINETSILTYEKWDEEKFNKLPSFITDKMKTSKQYKVLKGVEESINPDDIPF